LTRDARVGVGLTDTTGTIDERCCRYRTSAAGASTELRDRPYQRLLIDPGGSVQLNLRGRRPRPGL